MIRVGCGFDVHAFAAGRKLILGGVHIPHALGLAGHSDADVLTHALCDALLGACGLGDIGGMFPDTDPAYKDADSLLLLRQAFKTVRQQQRITVINADMTVAIEKPKISCYINEMRNNFANCLEVVPAQINVKATTSERLGFVGREEGVAAYAVILVESE